MFKKSLLTLFGVLPFCGDVLGLFLTLCNPCPLCYRGTLRTWFRSILRDLRRIPVVFYLCVVLIPGQDLEWLILVVEIHDHGAHCADRAIVLRFLKPWRVQALLQNVEGHGAGGQLEAISLLRSLSHKNKNVPFPVTASSAGSALQTRRFQTHTSHSVVM